MAGIMITIMSWMAYNEKLNFPQFVGMAIILTAIALMGFYQETMGSSDEAEELDLQT